MANPSWFNEAYYLTSKLEQLQASGETAYTNVLQVKAAIEAAGMTVYEHFSNYSLVEQTSPNQYFNTGEYLAAKAAQAGMTVDALMLAFNAAGFTNAYDHFARHGWLEGVNPSNAFDVSDYLAAKALESGLTVDEVTTAFVDGGFDPISHYVEYGEAEGVVVTPVPVDEQVAGGNGEAFTLTIGEDSGAAFTGTASNDVYDAPLVSDAGTLTATLQDIDVLDGAAGIDTLNATLAGTAVAATISNIEMLNLRVTNDTAVDFADVTGADQIWNNQSTTGTTLTYSNAPIDATFGVRNTRAVTDIDTFDDVSGASDELMLSVSGAGSSATDAVVTSGTDSAAIEAMSIAVAGTNFVDVSAFGSIETLTIAGAGEIEAVVDASALTTLAATDLTSGLDIDISLASSAELNAQTGVGDDRVVIDGTLLVTGNTDIVVDLGDGVNTLGLASIVDEATIDDLVFDEATIAGVSTLELTDGIILGAAGATLDLTGLDDVAALEVGGAVAGDFALAITDSPAVLDVTLASTLADTDLDFVDAGTVTLTAEGVVSGTASITGEALNDLTINAAADVTAAIVGDATDEWSVDTLTVADASDDGDSVVALALSDTLELTTIDLTGGDTSDFTIDATVAAFDAAVNVMVGVIGVDSEGALSGGLTYTTDSTNNVRETFQFVGANIGDVEITGFLAGVGATADRLDFSAFVGIDALDDLAMEVVGADTVITAADGQFDGTITVIGVDLTTDSLNFIV